MVRVWAVAVYVRRRRVPVRVAVFPFDRRIVHVIMVSVVVAMSVLVLQLLVGVTVLVLFGEVKIERYDEQECRDDRQRANGSISQEPSCNGTDEGSYGKNGACPTGPDRALGSQVESEADAVAQGPARQQQEGISQ